MQPDWLDTLDLTPPDPWHRMGVRLFDLAEWPEVDGEREAQLGEKARLIADRHDDVFMARPGSEPAGAEVSALVTQGLARRGITVEPTAGVHPLDAAARLVQDDLCVLERDDVGVFRLTAGSVCFPAEWRLADKIGGTVDEIHGPVHRYDFELGRRVNRYFDSLKPGAAGIRSNWFFHPDDALFAPEPRPIPRDPATSDDVAQRLWLRSERQLLAALPESRAILFGIRSRQARVDALADRPDLRAALADHLRACPARLVEHRGVAWCIEPLLEWLDG